MRLSKPSPAMIVAGIALVLASSGTTLAASRYLVTSTSQIKPSVLLALTRGGKLTEVTSGLVNHPGMGPQESAVAKCPNGTHVVSGGFRSFLPAGMTVKSSQPSLNGWLVIAGYAGNEGPASPSTPEPVQAYAVCAPGSP